MYRLEVASTISEGRGGGGGCFSQGCASSQSRNGCLSNDGGLVPGAQLSAGQNRDESGVSTSSQIDSFPSMVPSSNLVSQITTPCSSARVAAREYASRHSS